MKPEITITQGESSITFTIADYQYPEERSKGDEYNYDANWLDGLFVYTDGVIHEEYRDACLLTSELRELCEEFEKILQGEETSYISDFMEPYFKLCLLRHDDSVSIVLHFVYDTLNGIWKTRKVAETFSFDAAAEILDKLKELHSLFPKR